MGVGGSPFKLVLIPIKSFFEVPQDTCPDMTERWCFRYGQRYMERKVIVT